MADPQITATQISRTRWRLSTPITYMGITVPAGFITDFASIPRPLQGVINPTDYALAAVIHDWLWHLNRQDKGPDPVDSDRIFREALTEQGCPLWIRWPAWWAVRTAAILIGRPGRWGVAGGGLFVTASIFPAIAAAVVAVSL